MKVIRVLVYSGDVDELESMLERRTTEARSIGYVMNEKVCYVVQEGSEDAVVRVISVVKKVLALIAHPTGTGSKNVNWWDSS